MYNKEIDNKWQKIWDEKKSASFHKERIDKKYYCLEMFSYPSGAKLHVGHWYNYGPVDTFARFKKMQGYEVFQPMGFDAFGLPAENYAIKTGIHPYDSTMNNIDTMEKQLKAMGAMFNFDAEVVTCKEDYYKWTQWLFLKLLEMGLAYRKNANVNWCPSCNTVLANEQVIDGECERCSSVVTKKDLTQWFFKITDYAEELLDGLKELDWPDKTKKIQTNWIGKSTGSVATFKVEGKELAFDVFTTRVDTICGVSYVVIAPEHEMVAKITTEEQKSNIEEYIERCRRITEIDRLADDREKTGVFTGSYAINPVTGEKIQIWIADYVLATYGTGCVMAVPAHDERDFAFAKKYDLPVKQVVTSTDGENIDIKKEAFTKPGILINSGKFNGLTTDEAKNKITEYLKENELGDFKITYRLRDWLVSRQRYWGAPIPVVYCDICGIVPVPEKDLPVKLPYDVEFKPDGKSPLAKSEEFVSTTCPHCGGKAKRETDTLDTFVCSSWYQFRYPDNKNTDKIFDTEWIDKMLPVDKYVGGPEHAAMHLLYARFVTKALSDAGLTKVREPFKSLVHQGLILGPDGNKMSKSKGNVISPDVYVEKYGSDVFRMYLMFGFSYIEGGPWSEEGVTAMVKYFGRLERLLEKMISLKDTKVSEISKDESELCYLFHNLLKGINYDLEQMQFNTAIAKIMEITNAFYKYDQAVEDDKKNTKLLKETISQFIRIIAPFAPHFAEEMWERAGNEFSVFDNVYPQAEEKWLEKDEVEIPVQINGNVKFVILLNKDLGKEQVEKIVLADGRLESYLNGRAIKKIIVVTNKIINIVVG
ncbi:MAG: leucine--tRNA ligase [Clostridia bacterium]|nr:leucine--tRNA ligase [Clostridia bacterium]